MEELNKHPKTLGTSERKHGSERENLQTSQPGTGQTGAAPRSDRSDRSDRWSTPVRPVAPREPVNKASNVES